METTDRGVVTKAKILCVDDEPGIQEGCRRVLETQGYSLEGASTLEEGLRKVQEGHYDLVLLDVLMPDGRGIELLPRLRELDPTLITVIITGYATIELAVEAIRQGAHDFLSKPFGAERLLLTVNHALESRRLSLESRRLKALEREAAELARANAELERLDKFKSTFMSMVAHELRSPVAAIKLLLEAMLLGAVPREQQEAQLRLVVGRTTQLIALVNDMLDLAAAKERIGANEREVLGLADVLEEVFVLFKPQAEAKGISLELEIVERPTVLANREQIAQLWTNLIANAIAYTPEGGRVRVVLQQDEWAVGRVEDTGIGIAQEDQAKLFQEFFRTREAKQARPQGTGLGLALVQRIVSNHGGRIEARSTLGQGSCFTFHLPLSAP